MKYIWLTLAVVAACWMAGCSENWTPSARQIEDLEAKIPVDKLQFRSGNKLSSYERLYTGRVRQGERIIVGRLACPPFARQKPGVYIVPGRKEFPFLGRADAGCLVVQIVYSEKQKEITWMGCDPSFLGISPPIVSVAVLLLTY